MSLQDNLNLFRQSVSDFFLFIENGYKKDSGGNDLFNKDFQSFCVRSAFLGMYVAWETFIESCFIDYTLGVVSTTGLCIPRYVTPINPDHSNKILIGTNRYVDWSNPDTVVKLAELYLEKGEPFRTNINSITSIIYDLKTIRNSCAHLSTSTSKKLDGVAMRLLPQPASGIGVETLLLSQSNDPQAKPNATILDVFLDYIDTCAERIAKA